jgi:alanine or glycine:cation symporter, AGCS family
MKRLFTALTFLSVFGTTVAPSAAQDDTADKPVRSQPKEKGTSEKIDVVFGDLIDMLTYYPFHNIAPWFGLSTDPQFLADGEDGVSTTKATILKGHVGAVRGAIFTPDGKGVLTLGADNTVKLFDLRGNELTSHPHDAALTGAAMYPGGGEFATITENGKLRIFRKEKPTEKAADGKQIWKQSIEIAAHESAITRVVYSPDGVWLATGDSNGIVRLWDKMGQKECEFAEGNLGIKNIAITKDKDQLEEVIWILDGNDTIHIGKANGTAGEKLQGFKARDIEIGPNDEFVMVQISDRELKIFTIDGEDRGTIALTSDVKIERKAMVTGAEGLEIETLDDGGTKRWFDTKGTQLRTAENAASLADGFYFDTSSAENATALKSRHGDKVWVLKGHSQKILAKTFSLDGTRAVTTSEDGTAIVWEWFIRGPDGKTVATNIPFVVLWLVIAAVLFTIYMRFVNFRMFGHAIQVVRGKFSNPDDAGEVTHFQALSSALSATVGLGNIAGVAIAVSVGGPGATFWMIVAGLLGMTLKFTECTLGQMFRKVDNQGRVSGGPMHYLKEGLQQKGLGLLGMPIAIIFTVFCIGGSLAGGNAFQVNQSGDILKGQIPFFAEHPEVYGLILATMVGIVIIGGIKRIAQTAEKIVPTMCGIYVLAAMTILVMNIGEVPGAFGKIFGSALSGDAIYGGALGALITGFQRAAFSNEAGVGSASIAHSAAKTPYAVREGIVALLEPFIDTVVVCTMTALVIVITGVYADPAHADLVAGNNGAGLTAKAFDTVPVLAGWFPWVLMVAVILFAFSTMISWSYYGERCWTNLFGQKSSIYFKILFLGFTVLGSMVTATKVLEFGDVMILLMAFPNILGLYFLGGLVKSELKDYEAKKRNDEFQTYK